MSQKKEDEKWMHRALQLAARGMGHVSPNPMVGAVIVKDGVVLGEGYHERYGELHAERNALADCLARGNDPEGADIYVTLEPCCHYGKTPPCTEAIMEHRLARVVYGTTDPNPQVAGKGLSILRDAGIRTDGPVLEKECLELNHVFFHYITSGLPYVILKYAMTADGKIACASGDSRWVTGEESRQHTHGTRRLVSAIMVGIGTVLADDPMLNCRLEDPDAADTDPVRVICDSRLRIPETAAVVKTAGEIRTIVACVQGQEEEQKEKAERLAAFGVEVLPVPADAEGHADLEQLIRILGNQKIDSILIEGGSGLHFSAIQTGLVSEVQAYIAPKIVGGADAKTPVGGQGISRMADSVLLGTPEVTHIGSDILLTWRIGRG